MGDEARSPAAPTVDRLLGIADEKEAPAAGGAQNLFEQRPHGEELLDGGVLRLVDGEVANIATERRAQRIGVGNGRTRTLRRPSHAAADVAEAVQTLLGLRDRERRTGLGKHAQRTFQAAGQIPQKLRAQMGGEKHGEFMKLDGNRLLGIRMTIEERCEVRKVGQVA